MVPHEFSHLCIVKHEIPYSVPPEQHHGTHPHTGKLAIGRVVWTRTPLDLSTENSRKVDAFVEGVGKLEVDPAALKSLN